MAEKPILFQPDSVRAIMTCASCGTVTLEIVCPECGSTERLKTVTRGVIKPQHLIPNKGVVSKRDMKDFEVHSFKDGEYAYLKEFKGFCLGKLKSPYAPGDLLWVRESYYQLQGCFEEEYAGHQFGEAAYCGGGWGNLDGSEGFRKQDGTEVLSSEVIAYAADGIPAPFDGDTDNDVFRWIKHPSIFMPKKHARLWLKVKSSRVEQVQDITLEDAIAEGCSNDDLKGLCLYDCANHKCQYIGDKTLCEIYHTDEDCGETEAFGILWDSINKKPKPRYSKKKITHYESYPWEDIRETREYRGKPWYVYGNPWNWRYKFERIEHA